MRRLLLLTTIVVITWAILRHAAGTEPLPDYALRDTLLLLLAAAGATAWATRAEAPPRHTERAWSNAGRATFGAGAATALAGGLLPLFAPGAADYAPIVWGVGLALALLGVLLRGAIVRYAPPAVRWERDADGRIVGKPLAESSGGVGMDALGRHGWIALALLLFASTALRLWLVQRAPDYCLDSECDLLLALSANAPYTTLLIQPLAVWLMQWPSLLPGGGDEGVQALRIADALISSLALVALVPALRRLVSPGGVLLGVALAGFGAWTATPWPEAALFMPLVVWSAAAADAGRGARAWAVAGLTLGLTTVAAPDLLGAWLLWMVALLIMASIRRKGEPFAAPAALLLGMAAGGAMLLDNLDVLRLLPALPVYRTDLVTQAHTLYAAIVAPGALGLVALAVTGMGAALRAGKRGAIVYGAMAPLFIRLLIWPEGARHWPLLIPLLLLCAALAADQLLRATLRAGKPLARTSTLAAAGLALALVIALPGLWRAANAPQAVTNAGSSDMAQALIAYITAARGPAETAATAPLLLVPAPLLDDPLLQRAVAPEIQAGRVASYNLQSDLPFDGEAPAGIVYLLAVDDTTAREELWRVYPTGVAAIAEIDPMLPTLTTLTVDGPTVAAGRGLRQLVAAAGAGAGQNAANSADLSTSTGALDFNWAAYPPAPSPFVAEWHGSLIVRARGDYGFSVEAAPGALFSLLLDNRLILDSSAGLISHSDTLPAGAYVMIMRYQSGSTSDNLRVLWQPPGMEPAPIPMEALHNPTIPNVGLVGTYSSGALWDGLALAQRKDRVIQADPTAATPWSVAWQGQLAAPRTGEYLIGAVSDGAVLIEVDGQPLVTQMPDSADEGGYDPAEGAIYLEGGWTPISVRYATGNQAERTPEIKLYWQPPGSGPAPLSVDFLYPSLAPISPADVPLPALPAVVDPRLGDESFALSADSSYWLPQTRLPPRDLPTLNLERVAQFGACGADVTQLGAPHGLAWDETRQTLYVADSANRRVLALTLGNDDAIQPVLLSLPDLEEPVDVAVGPDGILYVLDSAAPRLVTYDPATATANAIALPEGFYRPRGLDVDATGLLYIADTGGARVAVIERSADDGESVAVQASFGGHGSALGNGQPVDVVATAQAVWAIAAEQGRLWRLDASGSLTAVKPTDTVNGPHLARLDDGRLFVSDPARRLVLLLSAQGRPLATLGDEGAFQQPTGVAAWQSANRLLLAVSDTAQCSVSVWRGPVR